MSIHRYKVHPQRNHRNMGPYRTDLRRSPIVQRDFKYFFGSIIGTPAEAALGRMMGLAHASRPR